MNFNDSAEKEAKDIWKETVLVTGLDCSLMKIGKFSVDALPEP
jgi:hypothetical protein